MKDKGHIANSFNIYFSSVAQTIIDNLNRDNNKSMTDINPIHYLDNKYNSIFETIFHPAGQK
jgi:hypothetical protein